METTELSWHAEEACMAAWPAPRELLLEGWLLRASGGSVRRPNSVNPVRGGASDPGPILDIAEAVYGSLGQTPLFRVLSIAEGMDERLAREGYEAEGETLMLYGGIDGFDIAPGDSAELTVAPTREWLRARADLSEVGAAESRIYAAMLASILLPRAFATTREEGRIAALAYGVICNGLAVIESVITDKSRRRRGHGRRAVGRLLQWARNENAHGVCLQTAADNGPAISLYHSLGFTTELHRYHYRRKPPHQRQT